MTWRVSSTARTDPRSHAPWTTRSPGGFRLEDRSRARGRSAARAPAQPAAPKSLATAPAQARTAAPAPG
eukprot:1146695-Alexandrium_andersonii.AAC.1